MCIINLEKSGFNTLLFRLALTEKLNFPPTVKQLDLALNLSDVFIKRKINSFVDKFRPEKTSDIELLYVHTQLLTKSLDKQ